MTPDPESAARRALGLLGGGLVLTPKLTTRDGPLSWTVEYVRRIRVSPGTVEFAPDAVTADGLEACLEKLMKRVAEQDKALLKHLTEKYADKVEETP